MHTSRGLWLLVPVLVAVLGCGREARHGGMAPRAASTPAADTVVTPGGPLARHAALEVHATFWLDVDSPAVAADLARRLGGFADAHGGWVQGTSLGGADGTSQVTLRVPPAAVGALRAVLEHTAGNTGNLREQTSSTDVTEALTDLDARLRAARATEARLLSLLDQRTGSLADVLATERALGDERTHIEQLESSQRSAQGRVDQATVDIWLAHRTGMAGKPLGQQLAHAAREGVEGARALVVGTVLLTLEAGPSLAVLAVMALGCWWLVRRVRSVRARTRAGARTAGSQGA